MVGQLVGMFRDGKINRPAILITNYHNWREHITSPLRGSGLADTSPSDSAARKRPRYGPPTDNYYQSNFPTTPNKVTRPESDAQSPTSKVIQNRKGKQTIGSGSTKATLVSTVEECVLFPTTPPPSSSLESTVTTTENGGRSNLHNVLDLCNKELDDELYN